MQLKGTVTKKKVVATSRPVESSIRTTPPSTGREGATAEQKLALTKDRKRRARELKEAGKG